MKLSIEELADKVNQDLVNLKSEDKRLSNNLSVRRIRDYISKGLLDKPFKDGKNIYFTELHYDKLIVLRTSQYDGLSDVTVKKILEGEYQQEIVNLDESYNDDKFKEIINDKNDLRNSILATINEIKSNNSGLIDKKVDLSGYNINASSASVAVPNQVLEGKMRSISGNLNYQDKSLLNTTRSGGTLSNSNYESQKTGVKNENFGFLGASRVWVEFPLSVNNKFYLKMEQGYTMSEDVKKEVLDNMKKILGIN
jgi:DNA-binding transcriptional MerR regulator